MTFLKTLCAAILIMASSPYAQASGAGDAPDEIAFSDGKPTSLRARVFNAVKAIPGAALETLEFYNPASVWNGKEPDRKELMLYGFLQLLHLTVEDPLTLLTREPIPGLTEAVRHTTQLGFLRFLQEERGRWIGVTGRDEKVATIDRLIFATKVHWACDIALFSLQHIYPGDYKEPVFFDIEAIWYKRIGFVAIVMTFYSFYLLHKLSELYTTPYRP